MVCECGWNGPRNCVLTAVNPFDEHETIKGCPSCASVTDLHTACYWLDCPSRAVGGKPTNDGYLWYCSIHEPDSQE